MWRFCRFSPRLSYLSAATVSTLSARPMEERCLRVEDAPIKHVKLLLLNHPPANLLTRALMCDLLDTIRELCDPDRGVCRGVVLASAVPDVFCAGWDGAALRGAAEARTYWESFQRLHVTLHTLPVPLVAAVGGDARGGGCAMALAADYRVMSRGAPRIGVDATKWGFAVPPFVAGALAHAVGCRRAERMLQLGETLCAEDAKGAGAVDEVVESADEALLPALDAVERLMSMEPFSFWMVKDVSRRALVAPLCTPALRAADVAYFCEMLNNPDVQRDLGAYMESHGMKDGNGEGGNVKE